VVHANSTDARAGQPPRVGLVVSKTVGNAVVRNRTKRVLRALMSSRIDLLSEGVDLVIRAKTELPGMPTATLGRDLDKVLTTVLSRVPSQEGR
jgi:ribonuclease P protein component